MMRSALLRRTLVLVVSTVLLSTLLTLGIYQMVAPRFFAESRSEDLMLKARIIGGQVERAVRREISSTTLLNLIGSNTSQWSAYVWVVDGEGQTLLRTQAQGSTNQPVGDLPTSLTAMVEQVLTGQETTHIGRLSALTVQARRGNRQPNVLTREDLLRLLDPQSTPRPTASAPAFTQDADMVVVGVPILYNQSVVGAVFMAQTMTEVLAGMRSLSNTLTLSVIVVALLMLPIAYLVSRQLAKPMKQMRDVALSMAAGDFTVRADEQVHGEIGELGGALNYLSGELGRTIAELVMEQERLRRILNGLSEGILAVDAQGGITHANPAMRTLFAGAPVPPPDSSPLAQRMAVAPSHQVWAGYDRVLGTGAPVLLTLAYGETVLRASISPLEDEEGRVVGAVGVFRDITQSERLEQTRRDYVANVSHELRTPLTALRALIEPLRDGLVTGEADRERLYGVMLRETLRLSRLVSDMLELSRLQSGVLSLEKLSFDPARVLREVFDKFEAHAEDHGQTLTLALPDAPLPAVLGNPDRTEQVLVTLLDNAIKYTPEGGRIALEAEADAEAVHVRVRDSGAGIEPGDLPHVFDRFYKADKAHQGNGTGLGLAIAREILTLLGEHIGVTSAPGEGACFTFTLHRHEEA